MLMWRGDAIRMVSVATYDWAKTLNVKKPLTLDSSDVDLFEELLPHLGLVLLVVIGIDMPDLMGEAPGIF